MLTSLGRSRPSAPLRCLSGRRSGRNGYVFGGRVVLCVTRIADPFPTAGHHLMDNILDTIVVNLVVVELIHESIGGRKGFGLVLSVDTRRPPLTDIFPIDAIIGSVVDVFVAELQTIQIGLQL